MINGMGAVFLLQQKVDRERKEKEEEERAKEAQKRKERQEALMNSRRQKILK